MTYWERIKVVCSSVWKTVEPTVKWLMTRTGSIIADLALTAVTQVAKNPDLLKKGNLSARQAAFDIVVSQAKQKGLELGADFAERHVNKMIEIQLDQIKEG